MSAIKELARSQNGTAPIAQLPGERIVVAPSGRAHRVFTVATARAPRQALKPIVEGLFMPGSVYIVVGPGGVGKTYAMCDLAVCFATSKAWLGRECKGGGVLVIDEQNGPRRMSDRIKETLDAHGAGDDTPMHYESLAKYNFFGRGADESASDLTYLIRLLDVKLVIVDSLTNVIRGAEERDNDAMRDAIETLRIVAAATDACIIVLHHTNKLNEFRGATNIRDQADGMLVCMKDSSDKSAIIFETAKARDLPDVRFAAQMNFEPGRFWLSSREVQHKLSDSEAWLVEQLRRAGGWVELSKLQAKARKSGELSPTTVRKAASSLRNRGIIEREEEQSGIGEVVKYRLSAKYASQK